MDKLRLFLIALCLCLLRPAHAQDLMPLGLEFLVNQQTSGSQTLPSVASNGDDGYVIAWVSGNNIIMARRYGADHQPVTDELQVAQGATRPYVYHWGGDRYLIAWTGGSPGIRVLNADNSLSDTYAMGLGTDFDLDIRGDVLLLAVAAGQHVHLRKWDLLTHDWIGPDVQASEAPSNNYRLPQVRWTSTGDIVAVYSGGSSPRYIYRKTFNANLLAQTPEAIVHTQNFGTIGIVQASVNAQDQLMVCYKTGVNGTDGFSCFVLDAGGAPIVPSLLSTSASYGADMASALFDNGGMVMAATTKSAFNDPEDYNVRANYGLSLGASTTGYQVATTTTSGSQRNVSLARLADGGFVLAWDGNGFQGDDNGVYARAFAAAGFPTAVPEHGDRAFEVRPNPFRERLTVNAADGGPMQVFDATGRMVHAASLVKGANEVALGQLAAGVYLLAWDLADGSRMLHRVVKE